MMTLLKQPAEVKSFAFNFRQRLRPGEVLASAVLTVPDASGLTAGPVTVQSPQVLFLVEGGTPGSYVLTCRATTEGGDVHEGEGLLEVVDL